MYHLDELEGEVTDLGAQVAHLTKKLATVKSFDALAAEIQKRDNCSRTTALAKARKEQPEAFTAYQGTEANDDFDTLVAGEVAKGAPAAVAAQRVGLRYPAATVIAKKGKTPFEDLVDQIMADEKVTRSVAMSRARKQEPAKFAHYQA